ncbi:MAG: hypothetical protein U5J96_01010 [Ignavibacteriaceae bacterium]|nr:hypothetical protein [Ignavibacteriaceae bacterium]
MGFKIYIAIIFSLLLVNEVFAQNQNIENKFYTGVFLEYNTLIITHNVKLYSDLNLYNNKTFILSLQPGGEFIYSLPGAERGFYSGSPYYDINLLGSIQLFPNYGISIKPFIGANYRFKANEINGTDTSFDIKYGATLQLNISKEFKIIGKIMNMPIDHPDDVSILLGVGFSFLVF